nr:uridine diphosphate glycosyltransferase [Paris polyphylla var. chinensis]
MASQTQPLHMLFFPFMAASHMIPLVDMAKLFAARGVKVTILTTPSNAETIKSAIEPGHQAIALALIPFPSVAVGLPEGCENLSAVPTIELQNRFCRALAMLRQPFDRVLIDLLPDCVVSDSFLPWTYEIAANYNVPRLVFHGTSHFSICISDSFDRHVPVVSLAPDGHECLIAPGLPHRIEMLRSQMLDLTGSGSDLPQLLAEEANLKSYGMVMNSFYELEPEYVRHFQKVLDRKSWNVGPVSLYNKDTIEMRSRGHTSVVDVNNCLKWLDGKSSGSVVYIAFGTLGEMGMDQVREIALGLEASGRPFIWVVRNVDWLPEDYEDMVGDRGMVIKGWAPQVLILSHQAVGGMVTHCGWNTCLEGVSAGVPMVTWPFFVEHFFNERLIVELLGIGVSLGVKECAIKKEEMPVLDSTKIERAVNRLMSEGDEAEVRRRRARELGEKAKRAIEEGGSSYIDVGNLIAELSCRPRPVHNKIPAVSP